LKVFEEDGYNDEDAKGKERVVQLMGEVSFSSFVSFCRIWLLSPSLTTLRIIIIIFKQMQSFGTPPTEIMGDLPPGFGVDPDGMPQIPEGCCVS